MLIGEIEKNGLQKIRVTNETHRRTYNPLEKSTKTVEMIDLKKRFGKKYRIFMDEAWDTEDSISNPDKLKDKPWYYEIRGKYGKIYLYGSNKLAVHINSNGISSRVERDNTDIFSLYLKTSEGSIFLFNPKYFEFVAKLIKAKRRRQITEEHRVKLVEAGKNFRFSTGIRCIKQG